MTPQHPHPLRCWTCTNKDCPFYEQRGYLTISSEERDTGIRVSEMTPAEFTSRFGCTSHTSAQQRIDAAIKILDEIEAFMKKEAKLTTLRWNDVEVYFQKKKALLRGDHP